MMATGLVHYIIDDKNPPTLRDVLLRGSYQMMALVTERDSDHANEPPRQLVPNTAYYEDLLPKAYARLELLASSTPEELRALYDAENAQLQASNAESREREQVEWNRLQSMRNRLDIVEGLPEGYREELARQMDEALERNNPSEFDKYRPKPLDYEAWFEREFNSAKNRIGRYSAELAAEKARTDMRNQWLAQLWAAVDALPPEESA